VASVSCRAAYINVQQRALTKRQWLCCKVLAEQSGTQYTLDDIEQSRQSRCVRAWLPFAKPTRSGGAPKLATEPMQSASRRDSIVFRIFSGRRFTSSVVDHHRSGFGHGAPQRVAGDALASERRRVAVLSQRSAQMTGFNTGPNTVTNDFKPGGIGYEEGWPFSRGRGCRSASEGHGEAGHRQSQNPLDLAMGRFSAGHRAIRRVSTAPIDCAWSGSLAQPCDPAALGGPHRYRSPCLGASPQGHCPVVPSVVIGLEVMRLTLGQLNTDGQDYRFAAEMDFGREPATGSASRGT
jgi:hypothetical protein